MPFSKRARTHAEQLSIMKARGLAVADEPFALHCLKHYNYYRLSIYARPFLVTIDPPVFKPGTRFEDVWELYCFDRALRQLVHEATKRFEISARSRWAYEMGHACGAFSYEDPANFTDAVRHAECLQKLDEQVKQSHEQFIAHFRSTYGLNRPPIWAACELMSFGVLSRMFAMKDLRIKKRIAQTYSLPEPILESLLHHLTYVRNLCAHHLRIWNRQFTITLSPPVSFPVDVAQSVTRKSPDNRRVYNTLVLLTHISKVIEGNFDWRARLLALITPHPIWCRHMGFPAGWQQLPVWK